LWQLESFGVEVRRCIGCAALTSQLCHLIGQIYVAKATTYLRLHRKGAWNNPLGLGKVRFANSSKHSDVVQWWSGVKEKGQGLKEGFRCVCHNASALTRQLPFLDFGRAVGDGRVRIRSVRSG